MRLVVRPAAGPLRGEVRVPGDKSIAHRWFILACTARGVSELHDLPASLDVRSTAACMAGLLPELRMDLQAFARAPEDDPEPIVGLVLDGAGLGSLQPPEEALFCGNSGTTMRLLTGVLAGQVFEAVLDGDHSLRRRPMERVAHPLRLMGADVRTDDGHPPVTVLGGFLNGIEYESPEPSAQVKSAILLAGVQAEGTTTVIESVSTRDHTERGLLALGAPVTIEPGRVSVQRFQHPGFRASIPGDVSSAAFVAAAAAVVPGSTAVIRGVGLNSTRTSWVRHLERMGASIVGHVEGERLGEPVGSLVAQAGDHLSSIVLNAEETAEAIDEIPVLAAVAAHARGESRFEGAGELRVKESDRLHGVVEGIRGLGGEAAVEGDTLVVAGGGLDGGVALGHEDHRLVMAFAVGALAARAECVIDGGEWAGISFPGFAGVLRDLGAEVEED